MLRCIRNGFGFRLPVAMRRKPRQLSGFELSACIIWGLCGSSRYLFLRYDARKIFAIVSAATQEIKCTR
jgi:hypothetical protein